MAMKICDYIMNARAPTTDLGSLPLGDLFRDNTFTKVSYPFLGSNNDFYSSEYITRISNFRKEVAPKL
jgi:hypothetical protein